MNKVQLNSDLQIIVYHKCRQFEHLIIVLVIQYHSIIFWGLEILIDVYLSWLKIKIKFDNYEKLEKV